MPGLDGGTYITRSDVLRGQSWNLASEDARRSTRGGCISASHVYRPKQLDRAEQRNVVLSTCALSGERLASPVVADLLGTLYNRRAVLEYILASKHASFSDEQAQHRYINQLREGGAAYDHLRSTQYVMVELSVYAYITSGGATHSNVFSVTLPPAAAGGTGAPVACPVTEVSSDKYPFVALVPCGHVLSQRAIGAVAGQDGVACPVCGTAYVDDVDVVPLAPDAETLETLRGSLTLRGDVLRRRKSSRKRQRAGLGGDDGTTKQAKKQTDSTPIQT